MVLHSFTSEGFILNRRNFAEADRVIDIYSKDKGKISLIAKGVRLPGSRKRGHIEIFSKISFQMVDGHGMGVLTEVDTLDNFKTIRKSINKVSLAYYFMEVIGKITHEAEENIELYGILSSFMEKLKVEKKLKSLKNEFAMEILKSLGYWPRDKKLTYPDDKLEEVIERQIDSIRVGKRMLE